MCKSRVCIYAASRLDLTINGNVFCTNLHRLSLRYGCVHDSSESLQTVAKPACVKCSDLDLHSDQSCILRIVELYVCMWQDTAAQDVSISCWNCFGECRSTWPLRRKLGISDKPVFCSGAEDVLRAEQQQIHLAQNVSSTELQQ